MRHPLTFCHVRESGIKRKKERKKISRKCIIRLSPAFSIERENVWEPASHLNTGIRPNTIIDITQPIRW